VTAVTEVREQLGVAPTCAAVGLARATYYRRREPLVDHPRRRRQSHRALGAEERQQVLEQLHAERFLDQAPAEVYATLLDEGIHHCSMRTMYRILETAGEVRERRDQVRHPSYAKPELLATRPNELWSWDITTLLGPKKWSYFYLYVILDVFSRYVVGWMIAHSQHASLGRRLFAETCERQGVAPGQLTVHADRGKPMTSKTVAQLFADLGVTKTHSRPHVSDDNPFSESHFRTMKYRPALPERYGCSEDACSIWGPLFDWYNHEHHHSGLALLTPADVHFGRVDEMVARRTEVLRAAYARHPERFVRGEPRAAEPPGAVWINPPLAPPAPGAAVVGEPHSDRARDTSAMTVAGCASQVELH
jgi:putative transposase